MDAKYIVSDMTCNHCVNTITNAIKSVDSAAIINIDLANHSLAVSQANSLELIEKAVKDEGYDIQK